LLTGTAQTNRDSIDAITSRLPVVLGLIGAIMSVLLFLLSGSVAIPLKALVVNLLSLTAAFGSIVDLPGRSVWGPHRPGRWWRTSKCYCSASPSADTSVARGIATPAASSPRRRS
jgi:hypothetical protein